jgi:hypothetical protein
MAHIIWGFSFFAEFLEKPKLPEKLVIETRKIQKPVKFFKASLKNSKLPERILTDGRKDTKTQKTFFLPQ